MNEFAIGMFNDAFDGIEPELNCGQNNLGVPRKLDKMVCLND